MVNTCLRFRRGIEQGIEYNCGTAHMSNLVVADQLKDFLRINTAQTHVGAGHGRDGPGKTPAVAVEHRQGPQVHRVHVHRPDRLVTQRVNIGTTMVVNHADRKSTRLNSSHVRISYAVFCLKKKKKKTTS